MKLMDINFNTLLFLCVLVVAVVGSHDKIESSTRKSSWNGQMKDASASATPFTDILSYTGHVFPIDSGETMLTFIDYFTEFIYPQGPAERKKHYQVLLGDCPPKSSSSSVEESPSSPLSVHWLPQSCSAIGLEFKVSSTIHKGSRNSVSLVYDRRDKSKRYIWKVFDVAEEYTSELSFLMIAQHPNIVKPVCILEKSNLPGIVMDFVDGSTSMAYFNQIFEEHSNSVDSGKSAMGNLREHQRTDRKDHQVAMYNLQRLSAQLFAALSYMHSLGFVHADLKPENVLVDAQGNAILIDFGFAIRRPYFKYRRGTDCTRAPELLRVIPNAPIYENIDWWAFGSTVAQWHAASKGVEMVRSPSSRSSRRKRKNSRRNTKTWAPIRLGHRRGFIFGPASKHLVDLLHPAVRQLLFHCMSLDPRLRMFNTPKQLQWLRNLPILKSAPWTDIDIRHLSHC